MENFLKNKYDLHNAPEVESATKRTEIRTVEEVPQSPDVQIQNYLDRFKEIIDRTDPEKRERGMRALKEVLYDKFIIKPEEIPEGYFDTQRRIAREQGHGDIEITEDIRAQHSEVIIADQKSSLNNWIDYLSSKDATYPDWLKYYSFRSVLGMGEYDKEKKQFTKRSKGTTKSFPDINREALAYVLDAIEKKYQGAKLEQDPVFLKLMQGENFAKLYAYAIDKVTPSSQEQLEKVKGEWVKYNQGSDHMPLVQSLQGHGTGWCTAGESTAKTQLQNGDFYVFYSEDEDGKPKIPRAAIRMQGNQIGEVRGVAEQQNLDPYIGDIVNEKLEEFPDGEAYEKKSDDMKKLTEIEKKVQQNQELNKNELIFIYEIDNKIEGFGYQRDPRIEEIRKTRNSEEDAPTVFECTPEQIAHNQDEINEDTKVYIGELFSNIFHLIGQCSSINHFYESFPDKKIFMFELNADQNINSPQRAEDAIRQNDIYVSKYSHDLLCKTEFSQESKKYNLVRFSVEDLGFPKGATTDEIYKKAQDFGLELCPAEVGPHLRLQYPGTEQMLIAMKQIPDLYGYFGVFHLCQLDNECVQLDGESTMPEWSWESDNKFVFRFRKVDL